MDDRVRREAQQRHRNNRFSHTNQPLDRRADDLGVAGELALAWLAGIEDYQPRRARTPWTMVLAGCFRIKVYTSTKPLSLLIKQGKVEADAYILAGCREPIVPANVWWLGWASSSDVREAPVVTPRAGRGDRYVQPAHQVKAADLRPMPALLQVLGIDPARLTLPYPDPETQHQRDVEAARQALGLTGQLGFDVQAGPGRDFED